MDDCKKPSGSFFASFYWSSRISTITVNWNQAKIQWLTVKCSQSIYVRTLTLFPTFRIGFLALYSLRVDDQIMHSSSYFLGLIKFCCNEWIFRIEFSWIRRKEFPFVIGLLSQIFPWVRENYCSDIVSSRRWSNANGASISL